MIKMFFNEKQAVLKGGKIGRSYFSPPPPLNFVSFCCGVRVGVVVNVYLPMRCPCVAWKRRWIRLCFLMVTSPVDLSKIQS